MKCSKEKTNFEIVCISYQKEGKISYPTGGLTLPIGAKIWFSGYYWYQKSPKSSFLPSNGGWYAPMGAGMFWLEAIAP